jgi:hypothetical protein
LTSERIKSYPSPPETRLVRQTCSVIVICLWLVTGFHLDRSVARPVDLEATKVLSRGSFSMSGGILSGVLGRPQRKGPGIVADIDAARTEQGQRLIHPAVLASPAIGKNKIEK